MADFIGTMSNAQLAALEEAALIMENKRHRQCGRVKGMLAVGVRFNKDKYEVYIRCKHCKVELSLQDCINVKK